MSRIAFVGDIHGSHKTMYAVMKEIAKYPDITVVIHVGDFGFYPDIITGFRKYPMHIPIYAIDGNHEDHKYLANFQNAVTELAPNIFYVPRGTVMEINGKTIGFIGGAASVDKAYRLKNGWHWDEEENITDEQIAKFDNVDSVDILVTHVPPQSTIQAHFDPLNLVRYFGLPITWTDPNADKIEALWERLGKPPLICGHMHKSVVDGNVRILDIAEVHVI